VTTTVSGSGVKASVPARHVIAAVIGNALSFYDFLTYATFSAQIGLTFFPTHDAKLSLLLSNVVFFLGFLARPVGGYVIGRMGDRIGRKPAMLWSFTLLGIGIAALAFTPSYASIGIAAPVLLILFRALQGFALGGEVGPTTAFLVESAPPEKRGFYTSLQYLTQDFAVLVAGLVGVVLSWYMSASGLEHYGWRIAFLLGTAIVPFGLYIRRDLPETLHEPMLDTIGVKPAIPEPPYLKVAALGLLMLASGTVVSYVLLYMTSYATVTLGMPVSLAFWATAINGGAGVCFDAVGGWLSDRFGRKPVMIAGWAVLFVATLPSFYLISSLRSGTALLGATAVLSIIAALASPAVLISITESLPRKVRSGALAVTYALAISIFGGSAQGIVTQFIRVTGNPMAPAWYMMGAILIGLAGMTMMKETAHRRVAV
jgi:MHS family citrate/tricarballylate:H+ symporter-like MFS transporter